MRYPDEVCLHSATRAQRLMAVGFFLSSCEIIRACVRAGGDSAAPFDAPPIMLCSSSEGLYGEGEGEGSGSGCGCGCSSSGGPPQSAVTMRSVSCAHAVQLHQTEMVRLPRTRLTLAFGFWPFSALRISLVSTPCAQHRSDLSHHPNPQQLWPQGGKAPHRSFCALS